MISAFSTWILLSEAKFMQRMQFYEGKGGETAP